MRCEKIGEKIILEKGKEREKGRRPDTHRVLGLQSPDAPQTGKAKWGLRQRTEYSTTIPLWRKYGIQIRLILVGREGAR